MPIAFRAIALCIRPGCTARLRPTLCGLEPFVCPACGSRSGAVEVPRIVRCGRHQPCREVIVRFAFDPVLQRYTGLVRIRDESLPPSHVHFLLETSLIKDTQAAVDLAERAMAVLRNLAAVRGKGQPSPSLESQLSLDLPTPEFLAQLRTLGRGWARASRRRR